MNLFELVREKVFWTLDSMHGGLVKNRLKEIEDVFYNGISEACVKQKMEKLFFEAAENTGFYAAYKGCRNLQDFPVVNKIIYKENYDAFVSKKYKDAKDNRFTYTSGSTGIPFTMIQNKEKYGGGVFSLSIFLTGKDGYRVGMRQGVLKVFGDANKISNFERIKQNIIPLDVVKLDDKNLEKIRKSIEKNKIK